MFFDEALGRVLYDDFGDFAVGYVLGLAWADAVQTALGSPLQGEARALASDCLAGAWIGTAITRLRQRRDHDDRAASAVPAVSPGDLDEAIQTALVVGDRAAQRRPSRAAPSRRSRRSATACSTACRRASPRSQRLTSAEPADGRTLTTRQRSRRSTSAPTASTSSSPARSAATASRR